MTHWRMLPRAVHTCWIVSFSDPTINIYNIVSVEYKLEIAQLHTLWKLDFDMKLTQLAAGSQQKWQHQRCQRHSAVSVPLVRRDWTTTLCQRHFYSQTTRHSAVTWWRHVDVLQHSVKDTSNCRHISHAEMQPRHGPVLFSSFLRFTPRCSYRDVNETRENRQWRKNLNLDQMCCTWAHAKEHTKG